MVTLDEIWRKAILPIDSTLKDAIRCLNDSSMKIALVVNAQGILEGTISDGDIRRGLLKGLDLGSAIERIIYRNALVVPPSFGRDMVIQLMRSNQLQQIPIVDEQQRVVGLHVWSQITTPPPRDNLMIIMAGGKGTRLMPHTENCPKPMVLVAGKPMLQHIIERSQQEGFNHFMLAINYLGHMIEGYFGDGSQFGVKIDYLREQTSLGTVGALTLFAQRPETPFVVTNGDVITDIRYGELLDFHVRYDATATMAVRVHEWQHPFGVVQINGVDIVGFEEKPIARTHINAGVYALSPNALEFLVNGEHCDMPTLFERIQAKSLRTVAYPMHEPWLDVGKPEDLKLARDQGEKLQREQV
ncbi:nucleotidyltransferase family protein [Polynucleobacter sp. MG-Unter2-18]|uniref:nucleotidyltransferase family protein n=1 Tax=Polynucleobacter sp. MG-Unter2-18 TaxID=2081052 RepID=UPI001BFD117D|nr:nucleotidyltransferase family protein [Polynucleobacter sp. MG-Unter2-18]QWD94858.1 nucleotidyltransferase family protein [Polynucleobacter sp. MG-Unter2-18]